jgi:copper(I)-binding protein
LEGASLTLLEIFMNFISLSRQLALSATLLAAMTAASAQDFKVGDLVIERPYATPSLVGRNIGGGFIN